ncbi:MAG: hypothetical protein GF317_13360 [Candidatus Lokiarchaeota archaeon]|nr:hypothetical protein [Candidatus Lokiarchaeota archaeon]MBD3200625.1 hypothetical protein [Candidatus Lokiarchaeota archaeon]
MKGLFYLALIIGFIMFYQQNPLYAIIIIGIFFGIFIYFKARKYRNTNNSNSKFSFLFGKPIGSPNNNANFLFYLLLTQMFDNSETGIEDYDNNYRKKVQNIEDKKQEMLKLLTEK